MEKKLKGFLLILGALIMGSVRKISPATSGTYIMCDLRVCLNLTRSKKP